MSIITISRQVGSYGDEVADLLSRKLGCRLITRQSIFEEFLKAIANSYELEVLSESAKSFLKESNRDGVYIEYIKNRISSLAKGQSIIIIGFGAQAMFKASTEALHFRIVAPDEARKRRIEKAYNLDSEEADIILHKSDRKRKKFVHAVYNEDMTSADLYHVTYNTSIFSVEECVSSIISVLHARENMLSETKDTTDIQEKDLIFERPLLKNESEKEFAKILDAYHIEWQYEPKTFPIEWDNEGNVISAFSPDFYLTKFNTYIELTTMKQKYVTEKNKKVKMIKKLYPGTHIKIVYKKDFYSIVERFNQMGVDKK